MKTTLNHILGLLMVILTIQPARAQRDILDYWGPDTTVTPPTLETYEEVIDHLYGALTPHLPTNILTNRTPDISRKLEFDGSSDEVSTWDDFMSIYTEMTGSMVNLETEPATLSEIDSVAREDYITGDLVNIGLLRYRFSSINPEAKKTGQVYWDEYRCKLSRNFFQEDPFITRETAMLTPLVPAYLKDGHVRVVLDYSYILTNVMDYPILCEIDFGDGRGFQEIQLGVPVDLYYSTDGLKDWNYRIYYEDGFILTGRSGFSTRNEDPVLSYPCGTGTTINKDVAIRDLPDHTITISADAVIENKKNHTPDKVTGQMGIYYGCGNTSCELRKPFIFVSGFGPQSDFFPYIGGGISFPSQKKLVDSKSEKLLYNHYNGVYGEEAGNGQAPGGNNGTNLLYKLRNEGYDIVIVYFDNGVDFVQNHAALVQEVIRLVNDMKRNNDHHFENIILDKAWVASVLATP